MRLYGDYVLLVHLSALHHYRIIIQTKEDNRRSEPIYGVSILTFLFLNYFCTKKDAIDNKRIQKLPETVNEPENELDE